MAETSTSTREARFYHPSSTPSQEVFSQMHGETRVGVHCKIMEWNKDRMVSYTYYDPNLILARHGHASDSLIFIIDGEVTIGDRLCPAGTLIVLEKDTAFGPLIAGPEGCTFLESYGTDITTVLLDNESYQTILAEKGIVANPGVHMTPPAE